MKQILTALVAGGLMFSVMSTYAQQQQMQQQQQQQQQMQQQQQ